MRSLILVVVSAFFLSLGFLVYYWLQPQHKASISHAPTTHPADLSYHPTESGGIGPAEGGVWVESFDQNTGKLAKRFRTDSFQRQPDGRYAVSKPIAEFWTWRNDLVIRVLRIEGTSGIVTAAHTRKEDDPFKSHQMETPSSGELHVVTVRINEPDATNQLKEVMTISMPNAWFDNESFTIYTQGYTDPDTGQTFAADEVPVSVRGDDNHPDFDGTGMTLKWNERDRKLDLLEIAHGNRLVIKNARKFAPGAPATVAQRPASQTPVEIMGSAFDRALFTRPLPAMYADADPNVPTPPPTTEEDSPQPRRRHRGHEPYTTGPIPEPHERHQHEENPEHPNIAPSNEAPLYRATFLDNVRIEQSGQQLVTANRMFVDFLMEQEHATTQPVTAPTANGASTAPPAKLPAEPTDSPAPTPPSNAPSVTPLSNVPLEVPAASNTEPPAAPSDGSTGRLHPHRASGGAQPSTEPAEPQAPVIVYWTGILRVQPLKSAETISPGDSIVTLEGSPVIARQNNSEIRCATLTYQTQDGAMTAEDGERLPLTLTTHDERGAPSVIHSEMMTYSRPRQTAVLRGKGNADMPAQSDGTTLKADWVKTCTIYFTPDSTGRDAIDHAELEGNVHVDHPQFKLRSDLLDLSFDPAHGPTTTAAKAAAPVTMPATVPSPVLNASPVTRPATNPAGTGMTQANLRQMVATGSVHCDLTDSSKKTQTIDCNRLTVLTVPGPDGKLTPRTINADGDVHAVDPDQDLHAGYMTVQLKPSTRPTTRVAATGPATLAASGQASTPATQPANGAFNGELESMTAHDNVVVVTKENTRATSDQMLVNMVDGKARVKLLGSPAKIVDKQSTVIGSIISLNPDGQQMTVDGEGEMHAIQQENPGSPPRPMDVFWSRSLLVNGKDNICDAIGAVKAVVLNADGSQDVAKGDHVRMLLEDAPAATTRPSTRPATRVATTGPSTQPSGELSLMGKKTVRQAIFYDNAEVSSTLLDAAGNLLRRNFVSASTIQYDVINKGATSLKRVTIPCPGRMLVEDYRPPATQPVKGAAPADNGDASGTRGATAFQWSHKLIYDDGVRQVLLEGDLQNPVIIDHRDNDKKDDAMRLTGDNVVADLEPIAPTTRPTGAPASPPPAAPIAPDGSDMHFTVKLVTCHGHLLLVSRGGELTADTMVYNPITHWVVARGTDRIAAVFTKLNADRRGDQPMSGDEMEYNTVTEELRVTHPRTRVLH